ncbi:MAG TPA: hypothetical protein VD866_25460 [Urbifossiella sp.]|nr:hypothetical protein [Urbifossiella sp.]
MSRRWVVAFGGVVVVGGLGLVGVQFRNAAAARETLRDQEAFTAQLDADRLTSRDRSEYQRQLVEELILGRVTLAAAADWLAEANESRPGWERGLDLNLAHLPDRRARAAHVLVTSVVAETAADPDRADEAVSRVTAEFEEMTDAADD